MATTSTAALAYRPPSRVLLTKAMERQLDRATKTLKVDLETQAFETDGAERGLAVVERLLFQSPGSMRRELDLPDGTRVEVRNDDRYLTRMPGQPEKASKAPVDLLYDVINVAAPMTDAGAVERVLKSMRVLGINPEVVSFARFDGKVAYLIGSKPWENDKPQLWLDKDTLLVVRVVMVTKGEGGAPARRTDVRYLGWGSAVGGNWFPQSIEVWTDERLVRRSITKNVERNVAFDATLFK